MSPVDFTVNILLTAIMRCGSCFVATFCTASRALACGSRQAVAEPAQGSRTGDAKCRARSRETRRVTATRTRASAGNGRRLSAPGASAVAVPSRGGGCRRGGPTPDGCPRSLRPVVARRHAVFRRRASRSVRVTRQTVPTILSPRKPTVKGAPTARRLLRNRGPLTVIFHGKPIGTYQVGRGRVADA
jgi:hypothetical protein